MVEVFNRIDVNYSLKDFDSDKKEKETVKVAKREAVKARYSFNEITEIGSGSGERTTIYKADNEAIKVICCQTKKCFGEDLEEEKKKLCRKVELDSDCREGIMNEIQCWMKLKSTDNIIPMYGFEIFSWICPEYDRVGVDCAVKMVLAECITDTIDKYILRKHESLKTKKTEDQDLIIQIGIDICTALIAIHRKKLVHRDIKPDNIFWFDDKFCLGDFGIALDQNNPQYLYGKAEKEWKKGTPVYWSPQQADGDIVDHRTDIYSLGLVLYELADTAPMSSHYDDRIHDHMLPELGSGVSEGLKGILRNACAYSPDHRYQTAEAFKNDLCRLKDDPTYIPESTESKFKQKMKQIETSHISEMGFRSNREISKNSRFRKLGINNQRNLEKYLCPETVWNAGKFWYDESCKPGSRFAGLDIDKRIMPLTSPKPHITDFPVNITTEPECNSEPIPLSEIIKHPENLHNMYLIGEGGIGKTTALHSIMKDTYKNKVFVSGSNEAFIIPVFVELSKAPASYCNTYKNKQSTFIQRYLFTLISSLAENHLIFESSYEMTSIMEMEADSIIKNIRHLLNSDNPNVKYLLLLDGLNEVSRRPLTDNKNNYIGTPVELIVDEIQELLKYQNISVVITSRADETLDALDDQFDRSYLTGVSEPVIEEYLKNKIDFKAIKENKRLMDTLKIPLFLKFYSQLYSTSEVSTPGEILYTFFSEHSTKYSMHNRITEIVKDRRSSGNTHSASISDERMQWFILDFLLPELGWYMAKNDLYTVDQAIIQNVMDSVLKGTSETDICGKYGVAMFSGYCNRNDGSINVKTYANKLLEMDSNERYIQKIVDYCVYSLGILYVNNQDYGFIHQHIRDFFAAMKLITVMEMALYITEDMSDKNAGLRCLNVLNNGFLNEEIAVFIGEILGEYLNTAILVDIKQQTAVPDEKRLLLTKVLSLYKGIFSKEESVGAAVGNLLTVFETAHKNLDNLDLSKLDLSRCNFNGMSLKGSSLDGSLVTKQTFFPYGHTSEITCIKVSPCGQYFLTGDSAGIVKLWHLKTRKYIRTVLNLKYTVNNIQYINEIDLLISTAFGVYIYESKNYTLKTQYKLACYGLSDAKSRMLLAHNSILGKRVKVDILHNESDKKINLGYIRGDFYPNLVAFSPDRKYVAFIDSQINLLVIYNLDSFSCVVPLFEADNKKSRFGSVFVSLCFDSTGNYLAVADHKFIRILCFNELIKQVNFTRQRRIFHRIENTRELYVQVSIPDNTSVSALKFINEDTFLAIGLSNRTLWLYDYKKNKSNNIHDFPSIISSIDILSKNNTDTMIIGDKDANIFILKFNNLKSLDTINIFPIYNTNARYINDIKPVTKGLFIFAKQEGQATYDFELNKIISYPSDGKKLFSFMKYSNSEQLVAIGKENGIVHIYSPSLSINKTIEISKNRIKYLEFSPDDKLLLITLENTSPKVVHMDSFDVFTLNTFHQKSDKAVFSADGKYIFCCNGNYIEKFSSETYERLYYVKKYQEPYHENTVDRTLNYFKENNYQYNPATDAICSPDIMYHQYSSKVTTVSCSPDFLYMAIAWDDGKVEIREMETLSCIAILESNTFVQSIAFTSDGETMAVPFGKSSVKIYDVNTWHCISILHGAEEAYTKPLSNEGHTKLVTCICFEEKTDSTDEKQVITASNDGTIKYWKPFSTNIIDHPSVKKHKYLSACKKVIKMLWEKFYILSGTIVGEDGTTINCNDIRICDKTIYYVPGLDIDGSTIRNLHPDSDLSEKDLYILKLNGAITE